MANRRFIDFPIASTVGDNDIVLIWQDGMNKQTTKGTLIQGAPTSLEGLTDVDIAGLINGQILQYNSTTGKWENVDRTGLNLSELGDVSIVSPTNGQVLVYNSSTSKWENSSGGYVPYTGAVTTVDLGAQGLRAGYIRFDTSVVSVPDEQGLVYWDQSRSTAALIMNGTLQHIGQDVFYYVKNSTGSSIPKGTAVRFDGTDGASGHLKIAPFLANGTYPSSYFMGVTAETIANGSFGQVMHFGELNGINTSGYTAGALLYASSTVAGAFQTTAPVAPNNIILVAAAVNSKNNGAIVVRPTLGSNINSDEGVKITSPTTGDLLQLQAGGLWENKTVAQVIGSAYVPSTRTITINGTTQDLSANRSYNVGTVTSVGLSSATSGVTIGSTPVTSSGTITIAIATATSTQNGLLSSTDWTTFNGKQNALGYTPVPETRTITINGTTQDLSANRTYNVGDMLLNTYQAVTGTKIFDPNRLLMAGEGTAQPTSLSNTQVSIAALTGHNSFGFNSSNNIYFNKGTTANGGIIAFSNTATRTYTLKDASGTLAFTSDIPANPVGGTGTTNYLSKFTGTSTIGNSQIFDNGTTIAIGNTAGGTGFALEINTNASTPRIDLIDNGSYTGSFKTNSLIVAIGNNSANPLDLITNGSTKARITSGGNLLVGTTTDSGFKLDVNGTGRFSNQITGPSGAVTEGKFNFIGYNNGYGGITANTGFDSSYNSVILYSNFNSNRSGQGNTSIPSWQLDLGGSFPNQDSFGIYRSAAGSFTFTNLFKITSNGNVGIGTTSPQYSLTIGNAASGFTSVATIASSSTGASVTNLLLQNTSSSETASTGVNLNFSGVSNWLGRINAQFVGGTGLGNADMTFWTPSGGTLSERMRITSGGNVLIGTTTDNGAKLQVNGNATATRLLLGTSTASSYRVSIVANSNFDTAGILMQDTNTGGRVYTLGSSITAVGNFEIFDGTAQTLRLSINGSGNVLLTSLGTGTVYSNGGTLTNTNPSDFNLKTNIKPINYGLNDILKLNPVSFHWKNDTINQGKQYGFIAQEVQKIMPDLVKQGEYLGLDKEAIFTTLVKAIQELNEKIK